MLAGARAGPDAAVPHVLVPRLMLLSYLACSAGACFAPFTNQVNTPHQICNINICTYLCIIFYQEMRLVKKSLLYIMQNVQVQIIMY
jgi:hypothetical protein